MLSQKVEKLQGLLREQKIDVLIAGNFGHLISDSILQYLLCRQLEYAIFIIPKKGRATLYAISFEVPHITEEYPVLRVRPIAAGLSGILKRSVQKGDRVAIHAEALPYSAGEEIRQLTGASVVPLEGLRAIIAVKLPEEVRQIRIAAEKTRKVFEAVMRKWKRYGTEADAAQSIHAEMLRQGVEPSFPTIVAAGKNAARPHHSPRDEKMRKGFCVIDMGVRTGGYCSDMTRTIYLGRPSKKERALYSTLRHTQEACAMLSVPGARAKDIDAACRRMLGKKLEKEFIHGLGHGVGTQVHEWPALNRTSAAVLADGMVVTIEPGVYREGAYGIRIEDDILVTKNGPDILTKTTKELIIID